MVLGRKLLKFPRIPVAILASLGLTAATSFSIGIGSSSPASARSLGPSNPSVLTARTKADRRLVVRNACDRALKFVFQYRVTAFDLDFNSQNFLILPGIELLVTHLDGTPYPVGEPNIHLWAATEDNVPVWEGDREVQFGDRAYKLRPTSLELLNPKQTNSPYLLVLSCDPEPASI